MKRMCLAAFAVILTGTGCCDTGAINDASANEQNISNSDIVEPRQVRGASPGSTVRLKLAYEIRFRERLIKYITDTTELYPESLWFQDHGPKEIRRLRKEIFALEEQLKELDN